MNKHTLEINGVTYEASIKDNKIFGIVYYDKNFTKVFLKKFKNAYTEELTTRFNNIAKHFTKEK